MRQAPDDRARDASAGPTEVRQPRTKGSLTGPRIGLLSPEHLAITRHSRGNNTFGCLICCLVDMLRHDFGAYAWRVVCWHGPNQNFADTRLSQSQLRTEMMPAQEGFSLRARVARSMFWIAWSRGALQLLTFATTLFIARILVPADYGVMALAAEVLGWILRRRSAAS